MKKLLAILATTLSAGIIVMGGFTGVAHATVGCNTSRNSVGAVAACYGTDTGVYVARIKCGKDHAGGVTVESFYRYGEYHAINSEQDSLVVCAGGWFVVVAQYFSTGQPWRTIPFG